MGGFHISRHGQSITDTWSFRRFPHSCSDVVTQPSMHSRLRTGRPSVQWLIHFCRYLHLDGTRDHSFVSNAMQSEVLTLYVDSLPLPIIWSTMVRELFHYRVFDRSSFPFGDPPLSFLDADLPLPDRFILFHCSAKYWFGFVLSSS